MQNKILQDKKTFDIKKLDNIPKKEKQPEQEHFSFNYIDRLMRERNDIDETKCKGR